MKFSATFRAASVCLLATMALAAQQTSTPPDHSAHPDATQVPRVPSAIRSMGAPSATTNVNSADVKTDHAIANARDLPKTVPAGRQVIGVALEGGGALGMAHIGFLKWMDENHIPIDRLAGTSMGGLIGALYATGKTPEEMEKIATGSVFTGIFVLSTPYTDVSFRRREDRSELPQAVQLGLKGGPSLRNSVLEDGSLNAFLRSQLASYNRVELSYDTLPTPYRCVATDLNTMKAVVFDGGPMPESVRASISIPAVFAPVEYRGHYLVDGATVDNLPTDIVRQDLHADVVIGVHLDSPPFAPSDITSVVGVFARTYAAGVALNERVGEAGADVLVTAETGKFSVTDYAKAKELIQAGYDAAEKQRAKLQGYQLNDEDWEAYMADRASRKRPELGPLQNVAVQGGSAGAQHAVKSDLAPLKGQAIVPDKVTGALRQVQGSGSYRSTYETYSPEDTTAINASASPEKQAEPATQAPMDRTRATAPDTGVLVRLSKVRNGPPFLLFGPDITAMNSNVTRTTFDFRLVDQDFGGYGSELRADLRVGFLTQASTEYYRAIGEHGYFVQPHVGLLRQPVYLWENQLRISEHLSQQAGGGLDFGRTFSRNLQMSLQYRAQEVRWHPVSGFDGTPAVSGLAQTIVVHGLYDGMESGVLSPKGMRVEVTAGSLFSTVNSETAPIFQASVTRAFQLPEGILGFSVEGDTYFRKNVTESLRYTLGGPLRLSASSIDEYRGTDEYLVRAGYLHRIATLPSGVGQGLYVSLAYEAGEVWSPERPVMLRQDGVLMGVAATPLGAIKFGGSIGDAGRRKIFFSFGRLF